VAASPTPIPAATEQQHHDNNNQDQFHRNSPLTPTGIRWAPKKQRRLKAIVPDKPVRVAQPAFCDVSNLARASDIGALALNRSRESLLRSYLGWRHIARIWLMRAAPGRTTAKFPTISNAETERPGMNRAFHVSLFLLLTFRMSLLAMLVRGLRVLFGAARVLLALGVVALAVMFGGGTMCLGSVFVVFSGLVMFISGHGILVGLLAPSRHKLAVSGNVPTTG
jgi:hypothetical protein